MFDRERYLTKGVAKEIEVEMQILLWSLVDNLQPPKDYLQVFELLKLSNGSTRIVHTQEEPEYRSEISVDIEVSKERLKIFIIDSGEYSTMLLSSEY
ncbi:DUF960 family protein [Proteiniclasticum ruminis]|uniref:DUF960 domain-containing protein n=1 Tax=Proteiniclasticum ruminis TaxID=398199 RepID=A0A1G8TFA7_9CLOT|nr:DUF960 family protein [Proteiniclasticum ruminis]SDJ40198.1 protein of unknown function [Proteiniclasticum ruminis]